MAASRGRPRRFRPLSFRGRLTLSYTILTALLLTVALCALAALVLARTIASARSEIAQAATTVRMLVRTNWPETDDQLIALAAAQVQRTGIRVVGYHRGPRGPQAFQGPPPGDQGGPPPDRADGPPPGPPGGASPNDHGPPIPPFGPGILFGLMQSRFVPLHDGVIVVSPDDSQGEAVVLYAIVFGIAEIVSVFASWAIGRAITQQAVRPLETVTSELQRFARGDFAPSLLETGDGGELGELVTAYNGAAKQVAAAFSERERTEQHLRLFLGEAGHEMRTPMTVISAYLDLLAATVKREAVLSPETLQSARVQMRRLRGLVERVMSLARMEGNESGNAELIDVVEVAQEAIDAVTAVREGIVRFTHDADDVVVRAEPWELREAIGNLVENALVYGGGTPVDVAITIEHATIVVRVRDGGPGITEADRARLFQHFFRGEAASGTHGTGLGLAIVARAAARLGGTIVLEHAGNPGGATFRLAIPIYRSESRDSKSAPKLFV
jgi:signal transduction histidine kinase